MITYKIPTKYNGNDYFLWESMICLSMKNTYKKQNLLYKDYRDSTSKVMGHKAISVWIYIYIYNCCINAIDVYEANTFHQVSVKKTRIDNNNESSTGNQ